MVMSFYEPFRPEHLYLLLLAHWNEGLRNDPDPRPAIKQLCTMTSVEPSTTVKKGPEKRAEGRCAWGVENPRKINVNLENYSAGLTRVWPESHCATVCHAQPSQPSAEPGFIVSIFQVAVTGWDALLENSYALCVCVQNTKKKTYVTYDI